MLVLVWTILSAGPIPVGAGQVETYLDNRKIIIHTYKPVGYNVGPLVLVFHGVGRNAAEYRDFARGLGDRHKAIILAPEFDRAQFPGRRYTQGGMLREGQLTPKQQWTWNLVPRLVEIVRRREGRPDLPFFLLGHSAGAQFVGRMAGFLETGAQRVVIANPSAYLSPERALAFPYGFGELPEELANDEAIRRYLAQPLTIFVGTEDKERDDYLDTSDAADTQGTTRYERGRNIFEAARAKARAAGWPFGWKLVEAPGVGHNARAMFDNPACDLALFDAPNAEAIALVAATADNRPMSNGLTSPALGDTISAKVPAFSLAPVPIKPVPPKTKVPRRLYPPAAPTESGRIPRRITKPMCTPETRPRGG